MNQPARRAPGKAGIAAAAVLAIASPFVAVKEGLVHMAYEDVVGVPTICYGHTGPEVRLGLRYTDAQCKAVLSQDLIEHAERLDRCITRAVTPYEGAAILSWGFNIGTGAACRSTLVRKLNAGAPASEWCAELDKWVYAGGFKLGGLVKRRGAERALCEGRASG